MCRRGRRTARPQPSDASTPPPPTKPSPGAPPTNRYCTWAPTAKFSTPHTTAPHPPACISMRSPALRTRRTSSPKCCSKNASTATTPTANPPSSCAVVRTWRASAACSPRTVFPRAPPRRSYRCATNPPYAPSWMRSACSSTPASAVRRRLTPPCTCPRQKAQKVRRRGSGAATRPSVQPKLKSSCAEASTTSSPKKAAPTPSGARRAPSPCSPPDSAVHPAWTCDDSASSYDPSNCKAAATAPATTCSSAPCYTLKPSPKRA